MRLAYRITVNVIGSQREFMDQVMYELGLDPNHDEESDRHAIAIGNMCGMNIIRDRTMDGINQVLN